MNDDQVIKRAIEIIDERLSNRRDPSRKLFTCGALAKMWFKLNIASLESERFIALWLDTQHRLIHAETVSKGTIDCAAIYPREVVKSGLKYNAAAVIFGHNHPSGMPEPSQSDIAITNKLKKALELIDIRTLDHIIVGENEAVSMAERGLI